MHNAYIRFRTTNEGNARITHLYLAKTQINNEHNFRCCSLYTAVNLYFNHLQLQPIYTRLLNMQTESIQKYEDKSDKGWKKQNKRMC